MPLFQTIPFNETTKILIWEITESYQVLFDNVILNESNTIRLNGMKSEIHQRAFLSVRKLFQEVGYTDNDLYYDEFGKPHLHDGTHISITHSHHFSAIIISDETVGIDIELQREKIIRIADKFVEYEYSYLNTEEEDCVKKLTVIWGAKESIFKIRNEQGISFKDHIQVAPFSLAENRTQATLFFDDLVKIFDIHYLEVENFTLVFAFEK
jgi:phosphopantetheinyl transferase